MVIGVIGDGKSFSRLFNAGSTKPECAMGNPEERHNPGQRHPYQETYVNPEKCFAVRCGNQGRDRGPCHGLLVDRVVGELDVYGEQDGKCRECV